MAKVLLEVQHLRKLFPLRSGILTSLLRRKQMFLHAVDDISFDIKEGEILSLVGESGCGKTTTGRVILRLEEPTSGKVLFDGVDVSGASPKEMRELRRSMQIIFQDPYSSLNPRKTIFQSVSEPLIVQKISESGKSNVERVTEALRSANILPEQVLYKYPHQLSGGERQRVALARAIVLRPRLIIADEPVSMLDVSIRSQVLNLMLGLRKQYNLTYLFVTHDLAIARHMADRVAVMYAGKIVEVIDSDSLIAESIHPYTKLLLSCVPEPDPEYEVTGVIGGEVMTPINPTPGCRFRFRCPHAVDACKEQTPELVEVGPNHMVACHLYSAK